MSQHVYMSQHIYMSQQAALSARPPAIAELQGMGHEFSTTQDCTMQQCLGSRRPVWATCACCPCSCQLSGNQLKSSDKTSQALGEAISNLSAMTSHPMHWMVNGSKC